MSLTLVNLFTAPAGEEDAFARQAILTPSDCP